MSLTKVSYSMINGASANVLDFGAYNDGSNTTATTTAIQNALNSLTGGGTLVFPPGVYSVNNITIPNTSAKAITITGQGNWTWYDVTGYGSVRIKSASAVAAFTVPSTSSGTKFENLILDGNGIGTLGVDGYSSKTTVENCFVGGYTTAGLSMAGGLCWIIYCVVTGNTGDGLRMASDGRVEGSYLSANSGWGLISYGTGMGGTLVYSNEMAFNALGGINVYTEGTSVGNLFISGNYIEDNGTAAVSGSTSYQIYLNGGTEKSLSNVKIIHNYISAVATPNNILGDLVHIVNAQNINFTNAVMIGSNGANTTEGYGIFCDNTSHINISNITSLNNNKSALYINSNCDTVTASNINVENCAYSGTSSSDAYGVYCQASNSLLSNILIVDYRSPSYSKGLNTSAPVTNYQYYGSLSSPESIAYGVYKDWTGKFTLLNAYLNGNIVFEPTTAPSSPTAGQVYYDSGTNKLYCWNGSSWNALF